MASSIFPSVKRKAIINELIIAGSVIIFFSWIIDNYFSKSWTEKRLVQYHYIYLENYYTQLIDMHHIATANFEMHLESDTAKMYYYIFNLRMLEKLIKLTATENASSELYLSDNLIDKSYNSITYSKYTAQLHNYYEKGDIESTKALTDKIIDSCEKVILAKQLISHNGIERLYKKMDIANKIFLSLYIFGSMILGLAFLLKIKD